MLKIDIILINKKFVDAVGLGAIPEVRVVNPPKDYGNFYTVEFRLCWYQGTKWHVEAVAVSQAELEKAEAHKIEARFDQAITRAKRRFEGYQEKQTPPQEG